jgi:SAM-dependent methyltransferase
MIPSASLAQDLYCPRCGGTVRETEGAFGCARCGGGYPHIGRIPCFVQDPALWRTLWLRRLDDYSTSVEMRVGALKQEAESPALLPRTRQRLLRLAAGFEHQLEAVTELFEPLEVGADPLPAMVIPSRPETGSAVLECYEHVFRDWVWGARECELSLAFLKPILPTGLEKVAVYGAGAGRLAVDIHQSCEPAKTFALDVNPLPFLIADRLLAGETLTLPEFPVDPNSDAEVVIARSLTRPFAPRDGFAFVFADALRPPFAPGTLDAVVTSWFIDVARADLRQTAAAINRVLRPGGLWLNLGPLRFHGELVRSYTIEEVLELVAGGAFELESNDRQDIPYFDSPVSGSRRTDTVFRFVARKSGDAAAVEIPDPLPPWVSNPLLPVPITPALVALGRTSMFTTGVLSMIDGTRSIVDVSQALGAAWGVEPGRLQDELRAFLARLPAS